MRCARDVNHAAAGPWGTHVGSRSTDREAGTAVGTWGAGPFANDSADELLDVLAATAPDGWAAALGALLTQGVADGEEADPAEVVAAATLVAAHVPGAGLAWPDLAHVQGRLDVATAVDLAPLAAQALRSCVPADGWYWDSWAGADDRAEARAVVARLLAVLDRR